MADNSSRKFKFISPGVYIDEIDNSAIPDIPAAIGPVVVGTARKGPGMLPVQVSSFSDFVTTFGEPIAGVEPGDYWREGNKSAPTFGGYAAQAWLKNSSTLTYVRLLGEQANDASGNGLAGWKAGTIDATPANGGAWGLVVWPSASLASTTTQTGSLAAVVYCATGRVAIDGSPVAEVMTGGALTSNAGCTMYPMTNRELTLLISADGTAGGGKKIKVSLDPNSPRFIRKVLNTNPTLTNSDITTTAAQTAAQGGKYWLGESYERSLVAVGANSIGELGAGINTSAHVAIFPLENGAIPSDGTELNDRNYGAIASSTGWFIAQDLGLAASYYSENMQRLFRCVARTKGSWAQEEIKISITNIVAPRGDFQQYGTFSLLIRSLGDTDDAPQILERFDSLTLNPASSNYIAKVIGDQYPEYNEDQEVNITYGTYENQSTYIRVEVDEDVDRGATDTRLLPFGVWGPQRYRTVLVASGSARFGVGGADGKPASNYTAEGTGYGGMPGAASSMIMGGNAATYGTLGGHDVASSTVVLSFGQKATKTNTSYRFSGSIVFPSVPLRTNNTWGRPRGMNNVFWGAWTGRTATDPTLSEQLVDCLRSPAKGLQGTPASVTHNIATQPSQSLGNSDPLQTSWVFSLDNVSGTLNSAGVARAAAYSEGYRRAGSSVSALQSYTGTLAAGIDKFTTTLHGGVDGFDITERDPFRLSTAFNAATDGKTSYPLFSIQKAINLISDPEVVQMNAVAMPGITQNVATDYLLDTAEDRGDSLALIDIQNVYTPDTANALSAAQRNAFTVKQAVDGLYARNLNTSYGATYYPWVLINDTNSGRSLWAPPSIVALGALSNTDNIAAPWFAPAGFARGGLTDGGGGVPVLDVSKRLTSADRDSLYEANINPIAKFPAEGIVIFGQKTLQQTASALDRINVRRLMIYLKREISFIASRLLFAPNTQDTWTRFTQQATPILSDVRSQFGIEDFRLILDESTTTPDLIDRNIIYAKLLVKPTRAAEFFAIDFVVTNSGASFED